LNVPYSPEYRTTGLDRSFVQKLAAAGGGSVITNPADAWSNNLPSVPQEYDMSLWLLLLAALLLPIDVGVRRLVVSRRELAAILEAVPLRRRSRARSESISPLVGVMRARRAQRETLAAEPGGAAPTAFGPPPAERAQRASTGRQFRSRPRPAAEPPEPAISPAAEDDSEEQSLAARLLAARQRKQ
jgi:hypothetical protein